MRPSIESDVSDKVVIKPGMKLVTCAQWMPDFDLDAKKEGEAVRVVFVKLVKENLWTTIHNCFGEEVLRPIDV